MHNHRDWVSALPEITLAINRSACISIGWLAPASIFSSLDEPRVRRAQELLANKMSEKQRERYFPKKDSYKDMVKRSGSFDKLPQPFSVGDFVFLDALSKGTLTKGTEEKRSKIYVIQEILKGQKVTRYNLVDLAFKPVTGSVYRQASSTKQYCC